MNHRKRFQQIILSLCLVCLGTVPILLPTVAQAQEPITLRVDRVDASAFPEVAVHLTVRNAYGVPIPDLTMDQFDVSEDRTLESRPITGLQPGVNQDLPVALLLAIDISGSMEGQPLLDAQAAAVRLLDHLGAEDKAGVLAFATAVNLDEPFPQLEPSREHDFTADRVPLYRLVDGLTAGGYTPLYDAAYKAVRLAARQPAGNRAVLLLTDGRDEGASGLRGSGSAVANEDTPIREANRAKVPVFTIGLGQDIDAPWLKRLALESGGTYQETPDSAQLAELFQNVLQLLKQQYRLTYTSGVPEDGADHGVLVSVKVGDNIVFDEATWGPAPLAPTATPVPPSPTPVPTDTPSPVPTATPLPTNTPVPTSTPVPTATPTTVVPADTSTTRPPFLPVDPLILLGGAVVMVVLGVAAMARVRQTRQAVNRCLNCGRGLPSPGAPCPDCGFAGEYEDEGA